MAAVGPYFVVTDMATVEPGIDAGSFVAAVEPYTDTEHMAAVELDEMVG